jgi:hypothetical protein
MVDLMSRATAFLQTKRVVNKRRYRTQNVFQRGGDPELKRNGIMTLAGKVFLNKITNGSPKSWQGENPEPTVTRHI